MRPDDMMRWSVPELVSHINNLESKLEAYESVNYDLAEAALRTLFKMTPSQCRLITGMLDGRIHKKEQLWQLMYYDRPNDAPEIKIVDVFICKIRASVSPWGINIETIWGSGYRLLNPEKLKAYIEGEPLERATEPPPEPPEVDRGEERHKIGENAAAVFEALKTLMNKDQIAVFTSRQLGIAAALKVKTQPYLKHLKESGYIRIIKRCSPYDPTSTWRVQMVKLELGQVMKKVPRKETFHS